MPSLIDVGSARMTAPWRACMVVLCERFRDDAQVWARVVPGESIDLTPLLHDLGRPLRQRVVLAVAQSFLDPTTTLPFGQLVHLPDRDLRSVLDALAIARGSLPID